MDFEWDATKAAISERKHGIPFEVVVRVFEDSERIERMDPSAEEERWATTGLIDGIEIYVVMRREGKHSASSQPERRIDMSEKNTGTVRFSLDAKNPPRMTAAQLKRLCEMKDGDINYSDAPASPRNAVWTRPGALVPEGNKKQITVRLDADVLEFFRKTGTRYQSRINAALREYMKAHEKAS